MMKGHFARLPIASLKRNRIRLKQRSREELEALARSWLKHPVHPILCRPDFTVFDGNGRLDGLESLGETEADVFITDAELTDDELAMLGFVTAHHRAPLDGVEQAVTVKKMKDSQPSVSNKEIAEALDIDPSDVTRLLSLFDCLPEVQQAARDGVIGKTDWYAISRSPDQLAALQMKLNGASRDDLERDRKRRSNGPAAQSGTRLSRIKVPAAAGDVVLSVPEDADLAVLDTLLKDAEKAVRLPRIKATPAAGDTPGMVMVSREAIDPTAEALLAEALKVVQDAKARKLTLKVAQAEWKEKAHVRVDEASRKT